MRCPERESELSLFFKNNGNPERESKLSLFFKNNGNFDHILYWAMVPSTYASEIRALGKSRFEAP